MPGTQSRGGEEDYSEGQPLNPGERRSFGNNLNWVSCQTGRRGIWSQVEVNLKKWEKRDLSCTSEFVKQDSHLLRCLPPGSDCTSLRISLVLPFRRQVASERVLTSADSCGSVLFYSFLLTFFLPKASSLPVKPERSPQRCPHP